MKFVEKIKEIWAKIVAWVKGVTSVADDFILKYAPIAVTVVNVIKEFNESDTMDLIEKILNTVGSKYGAKYIPIVREWLEKNLPIVIDSLNLASGVAAGATLAEKIAAAREGIAKLPIEIKATTWTSVASMLANSLADNKLSISEALAIVAYVYENELNK
jgi:hypothetical protein